MRRHILTLAILCAILFAFASSARAQATGADCSTANQPTKTWNQQPADPLCGSGYVGSHAFTVISTTVDTCINNNTGATYLSGVRQVTGNGVWQCYGVSATPNLKCNPRIEQQVTHATSSTDYNRFYLRAWDINPGYLYACTEIPGLARQDVWQCLGVACSGGGGGGGGGTCSPDKKNCGNGGGSPVIIDLNGHGFVLTSAADGVTFDISGTGQPVQMGWIAQGADNAFLALPGPDGLVHNGQQLFGNFTPQPPSDHPNGFAALAVYDDPKNGGNGDGVIDSRDAVFASLRLWIDANHDGICQPGELHTLPSLGVNSISLKYKEADRTDQYGNQFRYKSKVNPDDPDASRVDRAAYDVFFVIDVPAQTKNIKQLTPGAQPYKCRVPSKETALGMAGGS
jgi:hypothetical protein